MRHLLFRSALRIGETVQLSSSDAHYISRVLRLKEGDRFLALDSDGVLYTLRIATAGEGVSALVEEERRGRGSSAQGVSVTLYQALPKGNRFSDVVRQAVQAGATRIVPLLTERAVVHADGAERMKRWERIAREAVQQSGAVNPVVIDPPAELDSIHSAPGALSLALHEKPIAQGSLHGYLERVPGCVELAVGPEGGFSDREIDLLLSRGFKPLYLGPRVFRTETAAVYALGAVQMIVEERDTWQPTE